MTSKLPNVIDIITDNIMHAFENQQDHLRDVVHMLVGMAYANGQESSLSLGIKLGQKAGPEFKL